jgi:hypothetical protein
MISSSVSCPKCGECLTEQCEDKLRKNPHEDRFVVTCPKCGTVGLIEAIFGAPPNMKETKMDDDFGLERRSITHLTTYDRVRAFGKDGRWIDNTIHFTDGSEMLADREKAKVYMLKN